MKRILKQESERRKKVFLIRELPSLEAEYAISHGEFSSALIKEPYVAIIMSQDWCPDWLAMQRWLKMYETHAHINGYDVLIYTYLYNQFSLFSRFLELKEQIWKNALIPYVRYYTHTQCVAESNYVTPERFLQLFFKNHFQFMRGV